MTYHEAIDYLFRLQLFGAALGLETTRLLAHAAGDPHKQLRFIHVAGTNGKGSTCATLASIYKAAGFRVGLYTSPHLVSFRERIQVNGELIGEEDVASLVELMCNWIAGLPHTTHPTFFEVVTVMAARHFADRNCDVVIWETGLGGRLDATNIVTPLASVITNIALDHERWLGDSIDKIAAEKAGIIKPGIPALTAAEDSKALDVIRAVSEANASPLHVIASDELNPCIDFPLPGEHQRRNAALAVQTVQVLQDKLPVSPAALAHGVASTRWPGRFQIVKGESATIILDGAHNPAGGRALADTFRRQFPGCECTLVLGVLNDKNWADLCEAVAGVAGRIIVAPVSSPRTANPLELAATCRQCNPRAGVEVAQSAEDAMSRAKGDRIVLVTGSLYFVGEVISLLGLSTESNERSLNEWTQQTARRTESPAGGAGSQCGQP